MLARKSHSEELVMKLLTASVAVLGLVFLAPMPTEASIVSNWGYQVSTSWTSATPTGTGTGVYKDLSNKRLSWGSSLLADRSSLTISNEPDGNIDTYVVGTSVPGGSYQGQGITLTHHNEPVSGTTLTSAMMSTTLSLYAAGLIGNPAAKASIAPLDLQILFKETPNQTPCTVASATPCRDIFVMTTVLQNKTFTYDGTVYYLNIFPSNGNLNWLSDAACATVGITSGTSSQRCVGFTTEENKDTVLKFGFTVSTNPLTIPEPGSLALVGLALLGACLMRRKMMR
jgi:hypothetical protein